MPNELVLVTGGSGFVGVHCLVQLIQAGYAVRTTVRSLDRAEEVRAMVRDGGAEPSSIEFVAADLLKDDGWAEAVAGTTFVLHVASPFPLAQPKDENDLIIPARDGALRVLRAARDAGVKRVVLTSSFAAIGYGRAKRTSPFTEADWTDPTDPTISAYVKSKTIAERAAWDFVASEGGALELSVINPVGIFGPTLGKDLSASLELLKGLLDGAVPAVPRIESSAVDVRDVASMHLLAMTSPKAVGQRYLAVAGEPLSYPAIAKLMRDNLGDAGAKVPTRVIPNWLVKAGAPFISQFRAVAPQIGQYKRCDNSKARSELGWTPRSNDEAILSAARSLIEYG